MLHIRQALSPSFLYPKSNYRLKATSIKVKPTLVISRTSLDPSPTQTGSGKTFTMYGVRGDDELIGGWVKVRVRVRVRVRVKVHVRVRVRGGVRTRIMVIVRVWVRARVMVRVVLG